MDHVLAGFGLGLGLIAPIGSQNTFVITHSLRLKLPRCFAVAVAAATCDIVLITVGALGAAAALRTVPGLRGALLLAGALFLLYLARQSWKAQPETIAPTEPSRQLTKLLLATCGVSLLNPHAILDTVGVIGLAVVSAEEGGKLLAVGAGLASLTWFTGLAAAAAVLANRLGPIARRRIDVASAVVLVAFAAALAWEGAHQFA